MEINFDLNDADLRESIDTFEKEVTERVNRGIEAGAAIIAELVRSEAPKGATLALYHSITYQDVTTPGSDAVEYLIGVDGNSAADKYAADVEYGAPPHDVNIEELIPWVRSKGMPDEAAYAIAKVIKEQGTQAHPFLFHTVEENKNIIIREIERAMNGP